MKEGDSRQGPRLKLEALLGQGPRLADAADEWEGLLNTDAALGALDDVDKIDVAVADLTDLDENNGGVISGKRDRGSFYQRKGNTQAD
jgi:hypothetical protein